MIIGAVSGSIGVLVAIIATVALLVLYRQRRKKSFTSLQTNNALYLIFRSTTEKSRQSSSSNMQSHEIKNVTETASYVHLKDSPTGAMKKSETQSTILDTDCYSLVGEDTETKAAIKDKQVCTLYYCGNWQACNEQAPHNTDTKSVSLSVYLWVIIISILYSNNI